MATILDVGPAEGEDGEAGSSRGVCVDAGPAGRGSCSLTAACGQREAEPRVHVLGTNKHFSEKRKMLTHFFIGI